MNTQSTKKELSPIGEHLISICATKDELFKAVRLFDDFYIKILESYIEKINAGEYKTPEEIRLEMSAIIKMIRTQMFNPDWESAWKEFHTKRLSRIGRI